MPYSGVVSRRSFALAALAGGISFVAARCFFGVDIYDEAFYVATPYRFILGGRPFIDDLSISQQPTGILVWPFLKLLYALQGNLDGAVLFTRGLYFLFWGACAVAVFSAVKTLMDRWLAVFVALSFFLFIPFGLPNLSYNTLAIGCTTLVIFLNLTQGRDFFLVSGLLAGVAAFAYPPMLLFALSYGGILYWGIPAKRRRVPAYFGGLGAVLAALGLAYLGSRIDLAKVSAFSLAGNSGTAARTAGFGELPVLILAGRMPPWLWLFWLGAFAAMRRSKGLRVVLLAALPLIAFLVSRFLDWGVPFELAGFAFHLGMLAPFFLLLGADAFVKRLLILVWLPSVVVALVFGWFSGCGIFQIGWGFIAAQLLTLVFTMKLLSELGGPAAGPLPIVPAALVLLISFHFGTQVYCEPPIGELRHRIRAGPYRGLLTNDAKARFIEELSADLQRSSISNRTLLTSNLLPGAYLLSTLRPSGPSLWAVSPANAKACEERLPDTDVVVKLEDRPPINQYCARPDLQNAELEAAVRKSFAYTVTRGNYTLFYKRRPQ